MQYVWFSVASSNLVAKVVFLDRFSTWRIAARVELSACAPECVVCNDSEAQLCGVPGLIHVI